MPAEKKFDIDLAHGEAAEGVVRDLLVGKHEVKHDRVTVRTGNVFVEYLSRGELSGLSTTEAVWWEFVFDDAAGNPVSGLLIRTSKLRMVARDWCNRRGLKEGGDDGTSVGVLVPLECLVDPRKLECYKDG